MSVVLTLNLHQVGVVRQKATWSLGLSVLTIPAFGLMLIGFGVGGLFSFATIIAFLGSVVGSLLTLKQALDVALVPVLSLTSVKTLAIGLLAFFLFTVLMLKTSLIFTQGGFLSLMAIPTFTMAAMAYYNIKELGITPLGLAVTYWEFIICILAAVLIVLAYDDKRGRRRYR